MNKVTVGIIGGGPAGLSLAYLLGQYSGLKVTIFEAGFEPGGMSLTVRQGNSLVEMGTCYTTTAHKVLHKWMQAEGVSLRGITKQMFDGSVFEDYVKQGAGPPVSVQVLRYLNIRRNLVRRLASPTPSQKTLQEAARPAQEWLDQHNLPKISKLFHRAYTNLGYGFLDTTPVIHVIRWADFDLIWSGLRKKLRMPVEGWSEFWTRFSRHLDIRLNHRVSAIERTARGNTITTEDGELHTFEHIVCAIPVDDFSALTDPTESETYATESIQWGGYTTTLFSAENWFANDDVHSFSKALLPGAALGQVMSARLDGYEPDLGGHLYLSGQLSGDYSSSELRELLRKDIADKGAKVTNIILQKMWKYHAEYKPEAIRGGLMAQLEAMQGEQNTWYTGATFSHEAVSHIVNYNQKLARRMHTHLLA